MKKIAFILLLLSLCTSMFAQQTKEEAVKAVLNNFHKAIEKLDTTGISALFIKDSRVFEQSVNEGNVKSYLEHHLGPELKACKSFEFSNYNVDIIFSGKYAFSTETYNYTYAMAKDGRKLKNNGVSTSVLQKTKEGWKFVQTHISFGQPR